MFVIAAKLKTLEQCYEVYSHLYFVPEYSILENQNKILKIELFSRNKGAFPYTKIQDWEYPLSFFNLPQMYLFDNQGKFHEL